jgi:hypothetical protein
VAAAAATAPHRAGSSRLSKVVVSGGIFSAQPARGPAGPEPGAGVGRNGGGGGPQASTAPSMSGFMPAPAGEFKKSSQRVRIGSSTEAQAPGHVLGMPSVHSARGPSQHAYITNQCCITIQISDLSKCQCVTQQSTLNNL